ncbi:unnamed protein product [Arabidopsis arenosa]|uniref:Malectin-like domain-containing protein n=1 Tax=Arabidopsis arenosa TaxID=38785 RepID=A0A8S1ZIZ7_ARAAE|nr:unnamed protein product [Arabidopsis arenosa]
MFGFLLCRRKKAKALTWKVLKMLQSRLLLLKHQKYAKARHIRMDIADYIRNNDSTNALLRTEQLFLLENAISIYDLLLQFTDFIIRRFSPIRKHGELVNDDTSEAVSTLIYASVKCKDIPEMLTLSELVGQRYGQRYVTTAIQVLPGNLVNTEIKKKLSISSVSEHVKCRMVEEIAKESGYRLEILRLEHKSEIENEVFDVREKKLMDLDKEERSKKESPHEVYKFILTDVKDERSKKETSMKDDYIEDVMKSRLLAEKAKNSGHRLEILRPEYKPEIEKQVYEEEEKKVIDPDVDIRSYEESPHEVYKFSLTDFEEEIMEDDYIDEVKCRMLDEIMKKSGHRLEISRRKYQPENEKQVYEEEEKKVIDPDVDIRSYEESPHEVNEEEEKKVMNTDMDSRYDDESSEEVEKYFSLTDVEEERSNEDTSMEDDYIEDVKCRMMDKITKKFGHLLEILRPEYSRPEIGKQVNEEKEKKVMNMDIRSADQSPYKFKALKEEENKDKEYEQNDISTFNIGFISLDCGLVPKETTYVEKSTNITYRSDATFIDSGFPGKISEVYRTQLQQQTWALRSFPEGQRNCYNFTLTAKRKYLIRGTFIYGNYDGLNRLPSFDLYIGPNKWTSVSIPGVTNGSVNEMIHVLTQDRLQICLVKTGETTPFISSLELRPLNNNTYVTQSGSLIAVARVYFSPTPPFVRFDEDVHDRIWVPLLDNKTSLLSTELSVDTSNFYNVPQAVAKTAAVPANATQPLTIDWTLDDITAPSYIYMHFAEIQNLEANETREFNITYNGGKNWYSYFRPPKFSITTIYNPAAVSSLDGNFNFTFSMTRNSTLPPLINGLEIYQVLDLLQLDTDQDEFSAMMKIKTTYGLSKRSSWQGDPCAPELYRWEGLNCSYPVSEPPRIISLNLSGSNLSGTITSDISKLTQLRELDLSKNDLSGDIPDIFYDMKNLTLINLSGNPNLNRSVPDSLQEKIKSKSLKLIRDGTEKKSKTTLVVAITLSIVGVFALLVILAIIFFIRRKKQKTNEASGPASVTTGTVKSDARSSSSSIITKERKFTYSEVLKMTKNFERVLGKGGFGTVYHGNLDDTQVAVKMLSHSSAQGYKEFKAELGTGKRSVNVLSWETRMQIAVEAAQGYVIFESVQAQDQSGFISLDCGLVPKDTMYTEKTTNITYKSDAKYIDSGLVGRISDEYKPLLQQQGWTLRSFPEGERNCYNFNLTANSKYLIRGTFFYANYDGLRQVPKFDLHIGPNKWTSVKLDGVANGTILEMIHVLTRDRLQVCLVKTGEGIPFISSLELRPLNNNTYLTQSGSLIAVARAFFSPTPVFIRYDEDFHDRIWIRHVDSAKVSISTDLLVDTSNPYDVPQAVAKTACVPANASQPLIFYWTLDNNTSQSYVYMHFAEIQTLKDGEIREFNITYNGGQNVYSYLRPDKLEISTLFRSTPLSSPDGIFSISFTKTVSAMVNIKATYDLSKKVSWQGDPCVPQSYRWEGLNCSYPNSDQPRIISLNLAENKLTGTITPEISKLTQLIELNLSGNPGLNSTIPDSLQQRLDSKSLTLILSKTVTLKGKSKEVPIIAIVASVAGVFALLVILAIFFIFRRKNGESIKATEPPSVPSDIVNNETRPFNLSIITKERKYTYSEVLKMTKNFERVLGKGGFGTVYHGNLDDTQVAVKMLSHSSAQGYKEFKAEVKKYSKPGLGKRGGNVLTWENRMQIAVEAAQGEQNSD